MPTREMILECLQIAKPTCILSVPVLFNRVSLSLPGLQRKDFPLLAARFGVLRWVLCVYLDNVRYGGVLAVRASFRLLITIHRVLLLLLQLSVPLILFCGFVNRCTMV